MRFFKVVLSVLLLCFGVLAMANTKIGSREYKMLLTPSLFDGSQPVLVAETFWYELQTVIQQSIDRQTGGHFSLGKLRTVRFYDTVGTCRLRNNDLSFRERVENDDREITLKYRSLDRYVAGHQDMSGVESDAETKFEEDIGVPYTRKYSHSTTQSLSWSKNLNKVDDVVDLYPAVEAYGFDEDEPLVVVGNLTVTEKVFEGPYVDLGNEDAEFDLTLWYTSADATVPVVAEISFKYKDKDEDYSENVVTRAKTLFEAMQTMTNWIALDSLTKTSLVYAYDPQFCQ